MSEYGYVEQPILDWLCGDSGGTYPMGGLGWTYRDETAMAQFERPLEDPIVEEPLGGSHPQNQFRGEDQDPGEAGSGGASQGDVAAGPPRLE